VRAPLRRALQAGCSGERAAALPVAAIVRLAPQLVSSPACLRPARIAWSLVCARAPADLRKFAFSLVAILSATDILNQVFDLIEPSSDNMIAMLDGSIPITTRCYVQAVGDSFFELSSVLWTTAIAATLYCTVIWRWTFENNVLTFLKFSAWCYGIPLVLTVAPAIDHAFGPAGAACWIKEEKAYWQVRSTGTTE